MISSYEYIYMVCGIQTLILIYWSVKLVIDNTIVVIIITKLYFIPIPCVYYQHILNIIY